MAVVGRGERHPSDASVHRAQMAFRYLSGREEAIAADFSTQLAVALPRPRRTLSGCTHDDLTELALVLLAEIASLDDPASAARLGAFGEQLESREMPAELYPLCAHALVRSVQDQSEEWSTRLESAWVEVFSWGIGQVEAGARRARRDRAAEPETVILRVPLRRFLARWRQVTGKCPGRGPRPSRTRLAIAVVLVGLVVAIPSVLVHRAGTARQTVAAPEDPASLAVSVSVPSSVASETETRSPSGTRSTAAATATPSLSRTATRSASGAVPSTSGTSSATTSACRVSYAFGSEWPGGFVATVDFTNPSAQPWTGWSGSFGMSASATITDSWGATLSVTGGQVTVSPASYNATVPAGGTATIGFRAETTASVGALGPFSVNGTTCVVVS